MVESYRILDQEDLEFDPCESLYVMKIAYYRWSNKDSLDHDLLKGKRWIFFGKYSVMKINL